MTPQQVVFFFLDERDRDTFSRLFPSAMPLEIKPLPADYVPCLSGSIFSSVMRRTSAASRGDLAPAHVDRFVDVVPAFFSPPSLQDRTVLGRESRCQGVSRASSGRQQGGSGGRAPRWAVTRTAAGAARRRVSLGGAAAAAAAAAARAAGVLVWRLHQ